MVIRTHPLSEASLALPFDELRALAIRELERLANGDWTDFNTHDPGITILEQVCWALTDLGYRLDHPIPDLLAESGSDDSRGLVPPREALSCAPVTLADLRRLVLDVQGVGNCWIEPAEDGNTTDPGRTPPLYYDPQAKTLGMSQGAANAERVAIQGLWRVSIAMTRDAASGASEPGIAKAADRVRAAVAERLYAQRPIGEDFDGIDVLPFQPILVRADVEIEPTAEAAGLLDALWAAIDGHIAPEVPFQSLREALQSGRTLEESIVGPLLQHGVITDADLPGERRPTSLRMSDLLRVLMDVPGVRAVRRLQLARSDRAPTLLHPQLGNAPDPNAGFDWKSDLVELRPDSTPALAFGASDAPGFFRLYRDGAPIEPQVMPQPQRAAMVGAGQGTWAGRSQMQPTALASRIAGLRNKAVAYDRLLQVRRSILPGFPALPDDPAPADAPPPAIRSDESISSPIASEALLPLGRLRNIGRYRSIRHHFPRCYGVAPGDMPYEAPALRRAQVHQLGGFLHVLDQLLADAFAQAAAAGPLLAGEVPPPEPVASSAAAPAGGETASGLDAYVVGRIEPEPGLELDALRAPSSEQAFHAGLWQAMTEIRGPEQAAAQLCRQLDHLLARAGEAYLDADAGSGDAMSEKAARARVGARRALLQRLGPLAADRGRAMDCLREPGPENQAGVTERVRLKLGLRPERGERLLVVEHILLRAIAGDEFQTEPLLRDVAAADPYSLQLSFVLPEGAGRFATEGFRELVEHVIRQETPVHLGVYVRWLSREDFMRFEDDWAHWHARRRATLMARYGIVAASPGP